MPHLDRHRQLDRWWSTFDFSLSLSSLNLPPAKHLARNDFPQAFGHCDSARAFAFYRENALSSRQWSREPDEVVIGHRVSPACYIADAFPASLYLAWKYADNFEAGVIANANVGGDNCHRGAVLGAMLGAAAGTDRMPSRFFNGLHAATTLHQLVDELLGTGKNQPRRHHDTDHFGCSRRISCSVTTVQRSTRGSKGGGGGELAGHRHARATPRPRRRPFRATIILPGST